VYGSLRGRSLVKGEKNLELGCVDRNHADGQNVTLDLGVRYDSVDDETRTESHVLCNVGVQRNARSMESDVVGTRQCPPGRMIGDLFL